MQACALLGIANSDLALCAKDVSNLLGERNLRINRDYERRLWWSVLARAADDSPADPYAVVVKTRAQQALADLYGDELAAVNQEAEQVYRRLLKAAKGAGEVCPQPPSVSPLQAPCVHPTSLLKPGHYRIPLRYGSAATEVCACGAWRILHHGAGPWRHDSIAEAAKREDDA